MTTAVNGVSFGQRPYGFDPKKGNVTREQCIRDFKPGIYDPEAVERKNKFKTNVAFTLAGLSTAALLGFVLRKPIGKVFTKATEFVKPFLTKGLTKGKDLITKGTEFVKPIVSRGIEFAKNAYKTVANFVVDKFAKLVK
jgi:hypothetical protein